MNKKYKIVRKKPKHTNKRKIQKVVLISKETRNRKILYLILALITLIFLISEVYAWFGTQTNLAITNFGGTVDVSEFLKISLDGENWTQKIDLTNKTLQELAYSGNNNIEPVELLPVSSDGNIGSSATTLPLYKGTYNKRKSLSKILVCNETEKNFESEYYPNYIAFDLFLKSSSSLDNPQVLQLNADSYVSLINESLTKTINGEERTFLPGTGSGTENTIRVAIALFENEIPLDSTQEEVLSNLNNNNYIKNVCIWEPNSNCHVQYVVENNNNITGYDLAKDFTETSQFFTFALKNSAVGNTIHNAYNWNTAENPHLTLQNTIQTTKTSETDYRIAEGVTNLTNISDGESFMLSANKISKARVYIWMEGQDVDCINYASYGGGIDVRLGLTKGEKEGSKNVLNKTEEATE